MDNKGYLLEQQILFQIKKQQNKIIMNQTEINITEFLGKGWTKAISVKALSGENKLFFTQHQPQTAIHNIHDAIKRQEFKNNFNEAIKLGYRIESYSGGKYGNVYLFIREKVFALTEYGFNNILK